MKTLKNHLNNAAIEPPAQCSNCGCDGRVTVREFSMKAMHSLLAWNEVTEDLSSKPICNICYSDLREILIERADEIVEQPLQNLAKLNLSPQSIKKVSEVLAVKNLSKKKLPIQVSM